MNEESDVLRINMAPVKPMELLDFVKSCKALANEFDDFAESKGVSQCKLYIKEVRKGSIEVDLVALGECCFVVQQLMPLLERVNVVAEFVGYVRGAINWLISGNATLKECPYSPKTLGNISEFLDPVAKDKGASATIVNVNIGGDVNAPIYIDNSGANYAQNVCRRIKEEYSTPNAEHVEQTLLQWYQSRNSTEQVGDKAIINSISSKAIKTVFVDKNLKAKMITGTDNPFAGTWLVDVIVERIEGVPKLYKIESMERLKD